MGTSEGNLKRRNFLTAAAAAVVVETKLDAIPREVAPGIRITAMETEVLRFPPGRPFADAIHQFGSENGGLVLRLKTNSDITGWAYLSFGLTKAGPKIVESILQQEIKPLLIDQDPTFSKRLRADMWKATEYHGVEGLVTFAMAAVDMALWDIVGKLAKLPVYRLLGGFHSRLPVYDMCGWYYGKDGELSQYQAAIQAGLEEGFQAFKIKVGRYSLDDDVKRIRAAQALCGKSKKVMVDANQVFDFSEAVQRGKVYQELGCFWYEEPLQPEEKKQFGALAAALDMRIATGENLYGKYEFLDLLQQGGADVVQPDNRRAGGVSEWMEIAAIADAFHVKVASHGGGPTNMHMLLSMPNAIYMETGSLKKDASHVEALRMVDGNVLAPEMPGMGNELRRDYIEKFKI